MAKASKKVVSTGINMQFLAAIAAGTVKYVSQAEGQPLLMHVPPLVMVNFQDVDPSDVTKVGVTLTEDGAKMVAEAGKPADASNEAPKQSEFSIISGVELPVSKRGNKGGGAPIKYPFADLQIGQGFFVAATEKLPDPVKTLGSTVSSANMRYAKETGQTKEVTRAKRDGRKAALDVNGNKQMETVTRPVYLFERKFVIRGFKKGETYGTFTAPADGAFIARVPVE